MSSQLTEQQKCVLKDFEQLQKNLHYLPISELYLTGSNKEIELQGQSIQAQPIIQVLADLDGSRKMFDTEHKNVEKKLLEYRAKSNLIHSVSNLIHEYDINFRHLQKQRNELLSLIQSIHKDTSDLIYKQKKYIDLANSVKQALDYYTLMDKFEFNWVCEPSAREVFEDQLQPLLSELTDGIQFFSSNSNYSNSKKYLNGLIAAKTKVTSFIKSFFIKLLNKEYGFSIKNAKVQLHKSIDSFYPKSKPKFLAQFLACYPQFHRQLKLILLSARQAGNEEEANLLIKREAQIEQFILTQNSLSLISYIQKNSPEIYEQVILKFISFYRINFHEIFHRNMETKTNLALQKYQDHFREAFIQSAMILTCEAAYLEYCFRPSSQIAREYARGTLGKIVQFYSSFLVRLAKEPGKNKDPFLICNQVTYMMEEYAKFLRNYTSRQYQTYVLGAIIQHIEKFGSELLTSMVQKIGNKIINQLESVCQNMLPKFKQTADRLMLTQEIKQFVKLIPNLSYCPSQAEKYLISSLDTITKSIKEVSNRIQSRFQCYAWNIEMFALIDSSLEKLPYALVKKQMKIDVGQTSRLLQKVKSVDRTENLVKYATDLFSIIKTGVPTLSELTLDFNTFVREYYRQLKQKFVKDMVFVHAKNVIEFLQQLKSASPSEAAKLCEDSMIKNLQASFKLSIQNFASSSVKIIQLRANQFAVFKQGQKLLIDLVKLVQQALLDLMGMLYVEASRYTKETDQFENIGEIRSKFKF